MLEVVVHHRSIDRRLLRVERFGESELCEPGDQWRKNQEEQAETAAPVKVCQVLGDQGLQMRCVDTATLLRAM